MIIYLARHGQTTGDIENRYGGDYDDSLTERGKKQSAKLAEMFAEKGLQKLYSSPLARAKETASIVSSKTGLIVEVNRAFKERNGYGILTGLTKEEAARKYPKQVKKLKDVHLAVEGAEAYKDFQKRITAALEHLKGGSFETVAVITHGGPIRLIFRDILKMGEIDIGDCAFVAVESVGDSYKVIEKLGITEINR